MQIALAEAFVRPDGGVYVLSRHEVVLLRDTDGDGRADEKQLIVHLETEDDYPHNGLGGIAQLKDGSLLLCLGENHGFAFTLNGSDGTKLSGTGGYDGVIFSQGGNANVDRLAGGYLAGPRGRAVLPYVGSEATPPRLEQDRRGVAAPFYVLSHSFVKYLVERLGLERVKSLHGAADPARELEKRTGRPLDWWRDAWLAHVGKPEA